MYITKHIKKLSLKKVDIRLILQLKSAECQLFFNDNFLICLVIFIYIYVNII